MNLYSLTFKNKKIVKFCISGVLSAFVDLGILIVLVEIFNFNIIIANIISFSFAVMNSFAFNKLWTFRDGNKDYFRQFIKFLLISLLGLLLNTIFMTLLIYLNIWYVFAKIVVIVTVAFWNFSANNFWTFRNQK